MAQTKTWENEYHNPLLLTKDAKPQKDVLRFFKFLRKEQKIDLAELNVLDLGCGTGRNANYLAELDNNVVGYDISPTAIRIARQRAHELELKVDFEIKNIGEECNDLQSESIDLVLDILSSNSLNEKERNIYLSEVNRILKKGGYFFVKILCKEGDTNAKNLLKKFPGKEKDTYINQDMNLTERVFGREDFVQVYEKYFKILQLQKKTNYARFKGQVYKRNYWLAYLKKS